MNSRFLERLITYRENYRLDTAKVLLAQKIQYQFSIIQQTESVQQFRQLIGRAETVENLLLIEARAAKRYWGAWGDLVHDKVSWNGRHPHLGDPLNTLLDIGYHYLVNKLSKLCEEIFLPTSLGLFHKAQSRNAEPLIYDFMEWMRPFVVDRTLLIFLRKKKLPITKTNQKDIGMFLNKVKRRLERTFYNKRLGYCVTLEYWIRLNFLEFTKSVNSNVVYSPHFPSLRNETRCKKPPRKETADKELK